VRYRVKLFASLREKAGQAEWEHDIGRPIRGSQLIEAFFAEHPGLSGLRGTTRLAVNQAFCDLDPLLDERDEIALIPPVSGG